MKKSDLQKRVFELEHELEIAKLKRRVEQLESELTFERNKVTPMLIPLVLPYSNPTPWPHRPYEITC